MVHIVLPKRLFPRMTGDDLALVSQERSHLRGMQSLSVSMLKMPDERVQAVRSMLVRFKEEGARWMDPLIADVDRWLRILEEGMSGDELPSTVRQFGDYLTEYIRTSAGQRLYQQDPKTGTWEAYYANSVEYRPEQRETRYADYVPPRVELSLLYWELGSRYYSGVTFYHEAVDRRSIARSLADKGLAVESPDLRGRYLEAKARFDEVVDQVGRQYMAVGQATTLGDRNTGWPRYAMREAGEPAKVVVDATHVDGEDHRENRKVGHVEPNFWSRKQPKAENYLNADDLAGNRRLLSSGPRRPGSGLRPGGEVEDPEVPVRPYVPIYHLGHHRRYKINVMDLRDYVFDKTLADQLILPEVTKDLVNVLVSQGRVSFQDIVEGKGAGICVLLGGPPGVGKTLTAEVFAEATERPLLSVHAAQLGVSANDIERNLRETLQKGSRWNAVVLLDEADVYIAERGTDIHQNAIVVAFLRVLENHTATIFMTTNHLEGVDDAVASRCLARIDYEMPSKEDQRLIWKVLSELNGVYFYFKGCSHRKLGDKAWCICHEAVIERIVGKHDDLSGRDIKQLLKLAALWSESQGREIELDTIDFVRQFLPTREPTGG